MEKVRDGESQNREDAGARKGRKIAKHCVFPMLCGSGGSKNKLAKAAGAEPARQMKDEKLHAVVARSNLEAKMYKSRVLLMSKNCTPLWREAAKHISKSKVSKTGGFEPMLMCQLTTLTKFRNSTNNYHKYYRCNNYNNYNNCNN